MFSQFSQVSEGHRQRHERPGAGQWELQSAVPPGCGPTAAGRRGGGEGGSVEGAGLGLGDGWDGYHLGHGGNHRKRDGNDNLRYFHIPDFYTSFLLGYENRDI